MPPSVSDAYVPLPGLLCPAEPLRVLLALEARGVTITATDDDLLLRPRRLITADDITTVTRWKPHLVALVRLCEAVQ